MTDDVIESDSGDTVDLDLDEVAPILCSRVVTLLGDFADGELPPAEHARFEAHLASCPACATDLAGYLEVIRMAGWLPGINPTPAAERRLRALIAQAIKRNEPIDNSQDETIKDRPGI
jgi:anti-sigma factor RsiW